MVDQMFFIQNDKNATKLSQTLKQKTVNVLIRCDGWVKP